MIISDFLKKILKNYPQTSDFLPKILHHISETIVVYDEGYLACVFKLSGLPYETIDDEELARKYLALKDLFIAISKNFSTNGSLWITLKREKMNSYIYKDYKTDNKFCNQFINKYLQNFRSGNFYQNSYYITLLIKEKNIEVGKKTLLEQQKIILNYMSEYNLTLLSTYTNDNGIIFSQVYEFFASLINGITSPIPLGNNFAYKSIINSTLFFGADIAQIRSDINSSNKYAVMYDLKDFGVSKLKVLTSILSLAFEFNFTQSFTFTPTYEVLGDIKKQLNNLDSVGDKAFFQQEELIYAQGQSQAGTLTFGQYCASVVVFGDNPQEVVDNGSNIYGTFLSCGGYRLMKSGISAPATLFSQVPGSKIKPRKFPKAISNLIFATGFYNHSIGKEHGNPLGDGSALMPLLTESNTIYHFNYHYTNDKEVNIGDSIAGHTLILGTTESGKTTLNCAIISFLYRFKNIYIFILDLTQGMEIFIRALGGKYFALKEGQPTGMNPFLLEDNPTNRSFLYEFVQSCVGRKTDAVEEQDIKEAVDMLYTQPINQRDFNHLQVNSIELQQDLQCWKTSGKFAWVFTATNYENIYDPNKFTIVGFDVNDILKAQGENYRPTLPILSYIFHLRRLMLSRVWKLNSYMLTVVEEFWKATSFESIREIVKSILKNDRKLKSWVVLVTQSPEDAINSPIFATILQQTPTKIALPNPDAIYENSYDKLISKKEFEYLSKLDKNSRKFLIKQGNQTAVAKLDLYSMSEELAFLSGSQDNVEILYQVMQQYSEDVNQWYEPFLDAIRHKKNKKQGIKV